MRRSGFTTNGFRPTRGSRRRGTRCGQPRPPSRYGRSLTRHRARPEPATTASARGMTAVLATLDQELVTVSRRRSRQARLVEAILHVSSAAAGALEAAYGSAPWDSGHLNPC